jgi:DNA-binding MarR family transcriptional regulator
MVLKRKRVLAGTRRASHNVKSALLGRPGFLIRRLHQIHGYLFAQQTVDFGVTPVQYSVMTVLSERAESDQITIAREVGLERTTVADVLARLEARGLVTRHSDPMDQRVRLARLSAEGQKLVKNMFKAVERAHALTIAPLSKPEQKQLMMLLVRVLEANNEVGNVPFQLSKH